MLAVALAYVVTFTLPAAAATNKGDTWFTATAGVSNPAHEPRLDCGTVFVHGSALSAGGTYEIASIPGSGSGAALMDWAARTWATPVTTTVIASFDPNILVADAVADDNTQPNPSRATTSS